MLEINNLTKIYNPGEVTELCLFENFNLKIEDKEFLCVVGSNGSGKTSMLNVICGSIPVTKGNIVIDGCDVTDVPEYKRYSYIGRVYQNPALGTCPNLTIYENFSLADNKGKSYNLSSGINKKRKEYYKELLASLDLGLENKLDVKAGSLSGGQRQAMTLLMATLTPINFLILDEHTAALDPKTADKIMVLTNDIIKKNNLTALMVTHNLRYAIEYGTRLIMMHQGNIVLDLKGEEKQKAKIEDLLALFNSISIECGN